MSAKRAKPARPAKQPNKSAKSQPAATSPQGAYEQFLPRAKALGEVPVSRLSPSIVRAHVDVACRAIAPYAAKWKTLAAGADTALVAALPALARACEYAAGRIPSERSAGTISEAFAKVSPLRTAALDYLEAAAFCGLVDAGRVRAIRQGKGMLDAAGDAVAIAGVFHEFASALAGKHPFTAEQIQTLHDTGSWLVAQLKPNGAPRDKKARGPEATIKDQFAALVERAYADVEKIGVQVWGFAQLRAHVPSLHAVARAPRAARTPAPAPAS